MRLLDVRQFLKLLPLRVYNTDKVKLQLTASLLLHTRSFLAIVRSCIFFLVHSTHSPCLNTIQTFILNVCQALTVYRTEVTNAGPTPPTCYKLKRLCAIVCVLTLQACVLPYFLLRADSQRYFCARAAYRFNV